MTVTYYQCSSPYSGVTLRAFPGRPVQPLPALRATVSFFLFFHPLLDPVCFHVSQVVNHMSMMRDAVLDMNIQEVLQPCTGKFIALETPRYLLFCGTASEPVSAFHAMGHNPVGQAAVTADFFNGNTGPFGCLPQFFYVIFPACEVARAYPAIKPANSSHLCFVLLQS